jgi:hypothetical protein
MKPLLLLLILTLSGFNICLAQDGPPPGGPGEGGSGGGEMGGPGGPPPNGGGPGGPGGGRNNTYTLSGVYSLTDGSTKTVKNAIYKSETKDVSGVYVAKKSQLTLVNATVTTAGDTSSQENSSFYGLNAAVLAADGGAITLSGGVISSTGGGANGLFASGKGSVIAMTGGLIKATGGGGHGVMASGGGTIRLIGVDMDTAREHGAPVATDRGGGTIDVSGGTMKSAGEGSPGIYSTGVITATNATFIAIGSEAAVIEGKNFITLSDCTLSGYLKCGVMIYQSFSGDAQGHGGIYKMSSGSLSAEKGPLFYVTNTNGTIELKNVRLSAKSGVLLKAASDRWGRKGSNGGVAKLTADSQVLEGDLVADAGSSISVTLKGGSSWTGAADSAALTLDKNCTWIVTKDSVVTALSDSDAASGSSITNITGNGHTVKYDSALAANKWLDGKTYDLVNGGKLVPK